MLGFAVLLISGKLSIPVKNPIYAVLLMFLAWCFITSLLNLPSILDNYFKHTSGINRFVRQYFSLLLSCVAFFLLFWNVIKNLSTTDILLKIRKIFLLSLVVTSVYGFFETLYSVFHIGAALSVLKIFSYFPFLEGQVHADRISSITFEPPFLAIYLITIAGWMFSYILTEKGALKFVPTLAVLVLTFFSGSRTALLVIVLQLGIFVFYLYKMEKYRIYIVYSALFLAVFSFVLLALNAEKTIKSVSTKLESLNFQDNLTKNVSNKSRFGLQYAALRVFEENPVTGVGFGQNTYHSRHHYPGWATKNNYEFELFYKNPKEKSFPPGYNLYTRLLSETGLVGTLLFLYFLYLTIRRSLLLFSTKTGDEKIMGMILLVSFVGLTINWLQIDSFRMYGFWLCLAILIKQGNYKPTAQNE